MANLRIKTFLTAVGTGCHVDVLVELWSANKATLLATKVLEGGASISEDYPYWYNLTAGTTYVISVTNLSTNDTQANFDLNDGGSLVGQAVQEGTTFDFSFVASTNDIHLDGFAIITNCSPVGIVSQINNTTGRIDLLNNGSVIGNIPNLAVIDGWTNTYYSETTNFCSEIGNLSWVVSVLESKVCNTNNTTNQPVAVAYSGSKPTGLNLEFGINNTWTLGTWNLTLNRFEHTFQNVPNSENPVTVAYRIQDCTNEVGGSFTTCSEGNINPSGDEQYKVTINRTGTCATKIGWSVTDDVTTVSNFVTISQTQTEIEFTGLPSGVLYFFAVEIATNTTIDTVMVSSF